MEIKRIKNRMKKAQERFLAKSEDIGESCLARMMFKSKADGIAYCLDIIEDEYPEIQKEDSNGN